jgi:hypothetical protein
LVLPPARSTGQQPVPSTAGTISSRASNFDQETFQDNIKSSVVFAAAPMLSNAAKIHAEHDRDHLETVITIPGMRIPPGRFAIKPC